MRRLIGGVVTILLLLAASRPLVAQQAWQEHIDSLLIQTDDATPVAMYSIPVDQNKVAYVEVLMVALAPDFTSGALQADTVLFSRAVGNLIRIFQAFGTPLNNWSAPAPSYTLVANVATQSIDVVVTGKAATPVRWYLSIHYRVTT